ncbi:uncharacterized protein LOC117176555 [Belonocnema kinseyi]|uniref:uncharacterized protein LOC117176555 n=1 Tax=Belonocnema kinseyi TaxID=2817044 RepID=UPI00143D1F80|nr:uncharacterized protein LOC117176555 [Belonocnema kinseyi]
MKFESSINSMELSISESFSDSKWTNFQSAANSGFFSGKNSKKVRGRTICKRAASLGKSLPRKVPRIEQRRSMARKFYKFITSWNLLCWPSRTKVRKMYKWQITVSITCFNTLHMASESRYMVIRGLKIIRMKNCHPKTQGTGIPIIWRSSLIYFRKQRGKYKEEMRKVADS